ncbi:MAG: DOMON domain-containing protein [Eubacteriales bacterium]
MKNIYRALIIMMMFTLIISAFSFSVSAVTYPVRQFEKDYALYFDKAPVIDGFISADEWGEPTLVLNDDGSVPSSFSMRAGDTGVLADASNTPDEQCSIWLRWDETYFYVGVTYPDTAPFHQYADGSGEFWNGDVIQFGTDFGGNWEMQGNAQTASWGPEYKLHLFAECSNDKKDYAFSYNYTDYSELKYNINNDGKITTYETAIPWQNYITDNPEGIKDGKIIGFAFTILFANDKSDYYGWLGWGDNICYNQLDESRVGNNQIKLASIPAVNPAEITEPADRPVISEDTDINDAQIKVPQTADLGIASFIITLGVSGGYIAYRRRK